MPTTTAVKHVNNGKCPKCQEIFNTYEGFNTDLRAWFESLQDSHPSAHISCAGRGKAKQEEAVAKGASRAHYGESAHNFNCAIDLFVMQVGVDLYDRKWFMEIIEPNLEPFLNWYGKKGAKFYELPHIEVLDWRDLVKQGLAKLVE